MLAKCRDLPESDPDNQAVGDWGAASVLVKVWVWYTQLSKAANFNRDLKYDPSTDL